MDKKAIETDIKNYKIRQGALYKRSKFLKEWRERWIVLTTNYMYTFTNKNCDEMTDLIDLKDLKSYKSYLRKDQQMIPPGFKVRSADDMYYFCAKNCHEKWSWLVSLQRLMDYKYVGSSNYNNLDWIKTKGFESQLQFQTTSQKKGEVKTEVKGQQKPKQESQQKILKQIQDQKKELQKKKKQIQVMQSQLSVQLAKIQEQWRKIFEAKKQLQKKPQKEEENKQQNSENKGQSQNQKKQSTEIKQNEQNQEKNKTEQKKETYVNKLKTMYEKKSEQNEKINKGIKIQIHHKKQQPPKKQDISFYRSRTVSSLFEQFRDQTPLNNGLKYIIDFLIKIGIDETCGYKSLIISECKSNINKKHFFDIIIQLLNSQKHQQCENFMRFFQICFFQAPHALQQEQKIKIHKILILLLLNVEDQRKLRQILKNIFYMNKVKKYEKNQLGERLQKLIKQSQSIQTINWARKIYDDL